MAAYYNEIDPFACAWLRELIRAGHIAPGEVDERSIEDVRPDELAGFTQCHFFAGAGIWSYALRLAGWPDDRPVWTGSCPCPSFSTAGKGEGFEDARHLWPAWYRLISECGPATIFGEQVEAAIGFGWIDLVQTDLETQAYAFGKIVLGACSVGAPHIRLRVYFLADAQVIRASDDTKARQSNFKRIGHALSGSKSLYAERRSLNEHREKGFDGHDNGWSEAHRIVGAHGEVCERSDADRRRSQVRWPESRRQDRNGRNDDVRSETPELCETFNGDDPDSARPFAGQQASETTGYGRSSESTSSLSDGIKPECEGLEGHFGDVRDWRGPGWLDPLAARSVAEAGATRGFWADCDWWYGRDGKYRPIGPGLFPLAHGSPARVGRLRGYGNAINAEVAKTFIEAYIEVMKEKENAA